MSEYIELFKVVITICGSFIASMAAIKVELKWIMRELNEHTEDHKNHYQQISYIKERVFNAKR